MAAPAPALATSLLPICAEEVEWQSAYGRHSVHVARLVARGKFSGPPQPLDLRALAVRLEACGALQIPTADMPVTCRYISFKRPALLFGGAEREVHRLDVHRFSPASLLTVDTDGNLMISAGTGPDLYTSRDLFLALVHATLGNAMSTPPLALHQMVASKKLGADVDIAAFVAANAPVYEDAPDDSALHSSTMVPCEHEMIVRVWRDGNATFVGHTFGVVLALSTDLDVHVQAHLIPRPPIADA